MSHKTAGARFSVYNGDAKGTLLGINGQKVTYTFDHDFEVTHKHSRDWYDNHTYALEENATSE